MSATSSLDGIVLARAVASPRERRAAAVMAGLFVALLLCVLPWLQVAGPPIPAIVAMFTTGIVITDLASAFLLLIQCEADPDPSALLAACAYMFSALMGIAHILTFPGAVFPGIRIFGGPQLTSYIFSEWRLGVAAMMFAAALRSRRSRNSAGAPKRLWLGWPMAAAAGAIALVLASTAAEGRLPPLIAANGFNALGLALSWMAVALGVAAILVMWRKTQGKDVLHLWLMLALLTFCGDLVLTTLGAERFSLGWYAGRASGFVSACTLFLILLMRFAVQQRYALEITRALREKTIGLQVEIARRSEAEERLLHAQKMEAMGQLTGGIAHDFNNLLAAIVGNLDLLRQRVTLDGRASRLVNNALAGAERGTALTGQLLVFSRIQKIALEPVPLSQLFSSLEALLSRTLGVGFTVTFDLCAPDLYVVADHTQLEVAVLNLAFNARDAMPHGGTLLITAGLEHLDEAPDLEEGDYVRITVSDHGSGMTPDVLARAFEPFFTTKGVGKGTGLGLSQVFGLASRAGGTARVESRVGQGTSVHLILRRASPPQAALEHEDPLSHESSTGSGKVLVIDDDESVRDVLIGQLEEMGLDVAHASDGRSGLKMLDAADPDLLLVDFAMPGMNGAEVAKAARARLPRLPVVFISGFADTTAIERAVGRQALILRKPFRARELKAIIAEALRLQNPA